MEGGINPAGAMNKAIVIFLVIGAVVAASWKWLGKSSLYLGTPEILGGAVRTEDGKGGKLYYLTSQWEKRVFRMGRRSTSTKTVSWVYTDLWEIDAATAQPVARRRIKKEKVNGDQKAMGMEQGILWARIPELVGIRLSDGVVVADKAKIEAKNPSLAGLFPKPPEMGIFLTEAMQPLKFDPLAGMVVRLDDARRVRIDPLTLEATPYVALKGESSGGDGEKAEPPAVGEKVTSVASGMDWYSFVRGIATGGAEKKGAWLGLLSEADVEVFKSSRGVSHQMDFTVPARQKLYRAEMKEVEEFFGRRWAYGEPEVLPESPDFLMAGLLTTESGKGARGTALWRRDPDSVFVLSRDRLGDEGRLQLSRVSGPKGTAVWSVALPLANMSAWLPGERHGVMLGSNPSAERSRMAEENENPVMQVVSIDLVTGEVGSFNPDLHRNFPVVEEKRD